MASYKEVSWEQGRAYAIWARGCKFVAKEGLRQKKKMQVFYVVLAYLWSFVLYDVIFYSNYKELPTFAN